MKKQIVFTCFVVITSCQLYTRASAQIHVGPGQMFPSIYAASHSKTVRPGDTIFVHAGTYSDAGYVIDSLIGTPDKWITVMNYPGDSVSIHVQYTFQHAEYLKLKGLNFFGNDPAQSASVFHLLFFDYTYACFTANHDIIIDSCTFNELNNTGKGNTGACLKIDGTENFAVTNCLFANGTNITDGISLNADLNGQVANCKFINMPGDGSHCKGGSKNITYQRNLFINCTANGLDIGGDTGPQYFCPLGATWEADSRKVYANIFIGGNTGIRLCSCHNSLIINNTCFKLAEFAFRSLNASSNPIYLSNNVITNNIFTTYSANHIYLNASNNFTYNTEYFKNNLFHDYLNPDPTAINWSEMPGVNDSGSIIGDPMFTDTLSGDFSLEAGSPAIWAGSHVSEPVADFVGKNYSSGIRSIGAREFESKALDSCKRWLGWIGISGQQPREVYVEQYDTLRHYIESCAKNDDSYEAFPSLDGAVQNYSDDATRYDRYRDWLISVLYLNTTQLFYFCACMQSIAGTYVASVYHHVNNASLAVINYLRSIPACDQPGLEKEYKNSVDYLKGKGLDTTLPPLDSIGLGFLLKSGVPSTLTPLPSQYLTSFTSSPNPFRKELALEFTLNRMAYVQVAVYDDLGRLVWGDGRGSSLEAGTHDIHIDASSFPSGTLYARISTGFGVVKTVKLIHK